MYTAFETEIAIRPDDIDMNNHVHNSKYLEYIYSARYIQMKENYEMDMNVFYEREQTWVVSSVHIDYKRALKVDDKIFVRTKVESASGAQAKILFWIINKLHNKIAAEGYLLYTLISLKTGRPIRIPDDVIEMYSV